MLHSHRAPIWPALAAGLLLFWSSAPPAAAQNARLDTLGEVQTQIATVVERIKPAVVSLTIERELPSAAALRNMPQAPPPRRGRASGSGMIFRASDQFYYILTNAHVVRGARNAKVDVKLVTERESRPGEVVGSYDPTDTAVVRIPRRADDNLTAVTFGNADSLRIGQFVLAVGSPFEFENTVTLGIVSSLNRTIDEPPGEDGSTERQEYRGLIQTDAAINPGNSGGPLVNMAGEVVGINFVIVSPGPVGGSVGIGFAVPINRVIPFLDTLIERGFVTRGYLGVGLNDLEAQLGGASLQELRELLGTDLGAYVAQVEPNTPAGRAGLQPGDVIVALNGQAVRSSGDLVDMVSQAAPNSEVTLDVLRNKQKQQIKVTLGERPRTGTAVQSNLRRDPLGLTVELLSATRARELDVPQRGLLVREVAPGSVAQRAGLGENTVLLSGRRGNQTVVFESVAAYQRFVDEAAANGGLIQLWVSVPTEAGGRMERSVLVRVPRPEPVDR